MPELPEVETTRRGLEPHLIGRRIERIVLRRDALRWPIPAEVSARLVGEEIAIIRRRAKYLLLDTSAGSALWHLGMSGSLRVLAGDVPVRAHDHVDVALDDGRVLRFNDPRRFGCLLWQGPDQVHELLRGLGPEPLSDDFDGDHLFARSRGAEALDAAYGVLYLGWPCVLLIWLRDLNEAQGLYWTVLVFAVAWAADILAYLVGSAVGGPKLWPRFSPNKTWSGFIGGLTAGMIAGAAMAGWLDMGLLNAFWGGVLGLAAALATMGGDLWESALKRRFGVKDAGNLIPGHGGLLDRVDGLMFAVVVVSAGRLIVLMLERAA